jgi:hypothetical protein
VVKAPNADASLPILFDSCDTRLIYALLVTFQTPMYFSMHEDRQVDSCEESDDPGVGMQRSKQFSFIL